MTHSWLLAFALIYLTFFLDNVLLTVLVPIIPDWIRGEAVSQWAAAGGAPLASVMNASESGGAQAAVGAVLAAKAGAQLACAAPAAAAVCRTGPAPVLRAGTALLLLAALVFAGVSALGGGAWSGVLAGAGRAAQGAGAALAAVAGLALAAASAPPHRARAALSALLGAVALGVLVGYPFGGVAYALWSPGTPFLIIAVALLADLVLQYRFLDTEEYNQASEACESGVAAPGALRAEARRGAGGACAGAVLLTTAVMAALEPCLPLWIADKFHPQRWVGGAVFVPDSAAYLVSTTALGGAAGGGGRRGERLAVGGVVCVALAALALPHARSVGALAGPHALLGLGLGAADAALVPALVAGAGGRAPARAGLLQAAASAAYVAGPVAGGLAAWALGFETMVRALGVANLLYAAYLHRALQRHPLTEEWEEAVTPPGAARGELAPLTGFTPLH